MATAYISSERMSFDDQLSQIRADIEAYFKLLVDSLKERERELLSELDEITSSHKLEKDQHEQSLSEIEIMLKHTQENINSNILKGTQFGIVKMLEQQQRDIEFKLNCKSILFDSDDTLLDKIKYIGDIRINIDVYQPQDTSPSIVEDIYEVMESRGPGVFEGQFNLPWGVSVDYNVDNIYISDQSTSRIKVFNSQGKYLFKFGDKDGVSKVKLTRCIAVSKDFVLVSENKPGSLLVYDLTGIFLKQVCNKEGQNKGLSEPFGIAIDDVTGDIYVCDSADKCVKIFMADFSYKSEFGKGITSLRDVKLNKDKIYVLSNNFPFFNIFNSDLILIDQDISDSISKQLNTPNSFVIDRAGNFIFPSYSNNCILLCDKLGRVLDKITESISKPVGVAIDSQGRIIVVGHNNRLLIF